MGAFQSFGAVTLTQSYSPYGETVSSVGDGYSVYQFTGESRDANGLTFLRARYYAPQNGRFISRDTWNGEYNRPLSLNRWGYVEGNPVNLTDPSGECPLCWIIIIVLLGDTACAPPPLGPVPTVDSLTAKTLPPVLQTEFATGWVNGPGPTDYWQEIVFGDFDRPGVEISAKVNIPSGANGTVECVQNGKVRIDATDARGIHNDSQWHLDKEAVYPYGDTLDVNNNISGVHSLMAVDTPGVKLFSSKKHVTIKQDYRMFLVWRPRNAIDENRIPLASIDWGWSVTLENQADNNDGNGGINRINDWKITEGPNWYPNPIGQGVTTTTNTPVLSPVLSFDGYP